MTWTLTTLNVNGLRAATRKGFQGWLRQAAPDVLCLQELRVAAADMDDDHRAPDGWRSVQADAQKKGYSGVAVWSARPPRHSAIGGGLGWADEEGRIARMDLDVGTVISVYLPSGSSGEARQAMKEEFMAWFLDWSRALLATGRPVALCGDLNIAHQEIDIHNPKANAKNSGFLPHERAWFSDLLALGWVDVFRAVNPGRQEYSWWSNRGQARALNRGWRLDYVLASPALAAQAEAAWIEPTPNLSDHAPVSVRFRLP